MDFGNNYGVHPFWPFASNWVYGDAIFIIEPLWLAAALPALAFAVRARWLRLGLAAVLAALLVLAAVLPFVHRGSLVALIVLAAMSGAVGYAASPRLRSASMLATWTGIALVFVALSMRAQAALRLAAAADYPALHVVDTVTSPMPGNPLCWNALVVGTHASEYQVFTAHVAPVPRWISARACPYDSDTQPTASVVAVPPRRSIRATLAWRIRDTTRATARTRAR
jgi:inner membrane protein